MVSLTQLWEIVKDREAWHAVVHRVADSDTTERLNTSNNSSLGLRTVLFPWPRRFFLPHLLSTPLHLLSVVNFETGLNFISEHP